jgi:magnesium-transporting ATPase (P-type)
MEALLEAVRKGRVLLLNILQAIALFCVAMFSMALWPLAAEVLPVGVPPTLPPDMALLFLFVYIPLLLLSIIVSPAPPNVLKITPRKNVFNMSQDQERRFTLYLLGRAGFTMVAIYVVGWLCASSAKFDTSSEVRFHSHLGERVDILSVNVDSTELRAFRLVQDVMSLQALGSFVAHALTLQERGQIWGRIGLPHPKKAVAMYSIMAGVLVLHIGVLALRAYLRDGLSDYANLHLAVWLAVAVGFLATFCVGLTLNAHDEKRHRQEMQFRRLDFDTKLGMHSPR